MTTTTDTFDRFEIRKETVLWGVLLVNTELLLLLAYQLLSSSSITRIQSALIPFIWINIALWVVARRKRPAGTERQRVVALTVATVYFGLLTYFGGLWAPGPSEFGWRFAVDLASPSPGWTPIVHFDSPVFQIDIVFYQFVGYLALAFLIFGAVLDAASSAVAGVLGMLSCVSCNWPLFASIITGVLGGSTALAGTILEFSYSVSTMVFVLTVALLYYQPGWR